MDDETLSLLRTVVAAGRARDSYDGNSNDRLERLVQEGLLAVVSTAGTTSHSKTVRRQYQPTEQGRTMLRRLAEKGAA